MCLISRKFHVCRVEDLKPLRGEELAEALDAGELVYVRWPERQHVIMVDVGVRGYPQDAHGSYTGCYEKIAGMGSELARVAVRARPQGVRHHENRGVVA